MIGMVAKISNASNQKDPLEEVMATHSSNLAWRISMDRERSLAGYSPWVTESDTTKHARMLGDVSILSTPPYP